MNLLKSLAIATCLILSSTHLIAAESTSIADALMNGSTNYLLRYRLETVEQRNLTEDALASTLKARLGFKTDQYKDFSLFTEFDTVVATGAEQYNSGAGSSGVERAIYPVVADPDGSEINQAYLSYHGFTNTSLKFGRQRILMDNQRFVGGVGWRQNEQTYDAISLAKKLSRVHLQYAYIGNVNRIFGESVAAGDHNTRSHLLNLKQDFSLGSLSGYFYSIDNKDALAFSTNTFGLRWTAKGAFGNPAFGYGVEYASQSDNADNPVNYSADYLRMDTSYQFRFVKAYVGYEVLGGDANAPGSAFRTPLATLHAFNGWADQFLATPDAGLEDIFIGASGQFKQFTWNAKYHDFSSDSGAADFGQELDLSIATKLNKHYSVLLKVADFNSDTGSRPDVSKVWLMLQAKF